MPRSRGVPDFSRQQEKGTTAVNDFRPLQGPGRGKHAAARESTLWEFSLTGPGRNYSPRREAVPDEAACTQRPAFAPKVLTAKTVPQDNLLQDGFYWNKQARFPCAALNEKSAVLTLTGQPQLQSSCHCSLWPRSPPAHNRWGWWKTCRQRLSCTTPVSIETHSALRLLPCYR